MWGIFWAWYERHYALNISLAFGLFVLQIIHLVWLTGDVVWARLFGFELFGITGIWELVIVFVDYTEIPAIISVSLVYINELRRSTALTASRRWFNTNTLFLILLNSQWLHIFWITDEFVIDVFSDPGLTALPVWLAWIAILIDYLEIPVMVNTGRRFWRAVWHDTMEK